MSISKFLEVEKYVFEKNLSIFEINKMFEDGYFYDGIIINSGKVLGYYKEGWKNEKILCTWLLFMPLWWLC